jgi:DNA-binding CsgD family transcriptional regulator
VLTATLSKSSFSPAHAVRRVAERELTRSHLGNTPPTPSHKVEEEEPISTFWRALVAGELLVRETFTLERFCCALAEERDISSEPRRALTEREVILVHRALQSETQKVLAAGFDLSVPAVSQLLSGALRKMGVRCRVGSTPLPLVLTVLRYAHAIQLPRAELVRFEHEGRGYVALGLPALDIDALPALSHAEREVARLTAIGQSPVEVAEQRGTAPCTVTNQLASLHRKLGVRGRFELIRRWAWFQWGNVSVA